MTTKYGQYKLYVARTVMEQLNCYGNNPLVWWMNAHLMFTFGRARGM